MSQKLTLQVSKVCNGCRQEKAADEYYKSKEGRLLFLCKSCFKTRNSEMRIKHKEKIDLYDAGRGPGWNRSGREKYIVPKAVAWGRHIWKAYKLTVDQYEQMFAIQQTVCAICKCLCNRTSSNRLCVDHDHVTGAVRGLLCFQCNVGLGKFKDNAQLLAQAAHYISGSAV